MNLAEHQRSLLTTMGIDLWVPTVDVETRHFQTALYRDTVAPEALQVGTLALAPVEFLKQNQQIITQLIARQSININTSDLSSLENNPVSPQQLQQNIADVSLLGQAKSHAQATEHISKTTQLQTQLSTEPAIQLEAFEIQAFCIETCVILVEGTHLTTEQKALWLNIQRAVSGQFYDLKWPFPMMQYQDGKGASMYVQGFIDALKQDRKILSLGQFAHLNHADVVHLASLQEMIEQPILKRRLWQFMQNKIH